MPSRRTNPCYECTDRHLSCHSNCKAYLAWRKTLDKEKALKEKELQKRYLKGGNNWNGKVI